MLEISKSDWKKYREKIGKWQENYMEHLRMSFSFVDVNLTD